ncbi:TetR/AcrR family transcriptional regulator [Agromyces sp. G08B096]|uniref:TetR/AcrR family transcriptional regulator n=1 Tax=Agromyces sp. G08B096 TaxID=3156399 RepID=A0AAU7W6E1_9MICO
MTAHPATHEPPAGARPEKRRAILAGARDVFARDGFSRASIDAIASAAGVSTRTIYKHFGDKTALFEAVVIESSRTVAEAEIAALDAHLGAVSSADDVEGALRTFALAWLGATGRPADDHELVTHRALIAQLRTDAAQLPAELRRAWWADGPGRVRGALAAVFERWSSRGWIEVEDAPLAAAQFSALVAAVPDPLETDVSDATRAKRIAAGVATFVHGVSNRSSSGRRPG